MAQARIEKWDLGSEARQTLVQISLLPLTSYVISSNILTSLSLGFPIYKSRLKLSLSHRVVVRIKRQYNPDHSRLLVDSSDSYLYNYY